MGQWRVVYEWTRAVFAVLGAIGGMIVLVLLLALFRTRSTNTEEWNEFDGATVKLYVNGVQVASQAQTTSLATGTGTLQIGGDAYRPAPLLARGEHQLRQ